MTPRLAGRAVAAVLSHQVKECSGLGQPADLGHSSYIQEPGVRRSAGGNMAARRGASVLEVIVHYIILNDGILKLNSSIFPRSEEYNTQYTP